MRRLLLAALLVLTAAAAPAQEARNPDIEGVIRQQMDAFLKDDVGTAFALASPAIKGLFGSAERFGAMVQQGYPMVWRPADVRFGPLRDVAGRLWQRVIVTDAEGRVHALDYQMIPAGEGGWQINGVQILPAPDVGA